MDIRVIAPTLRDLPAYRDALVRGWLPYASAQESLRLSELMRIDADAPAFIAAQDAPSGAPPDVMTPDGSVFKRIPSFRRWIFDGDVFSGALSFRWLPGTTELPRHVLGHIGYTLVPWQRGAGRMAAALRLFLNEARALGFPHVEITCDPDNIASKRVIISCGGKSVGGVEQPVDRGYGYPPQLEFRIDL